MLDHLRANWPTLPVVVADDEEIARAALARGAMDYVTKPFDFDRLGRVIRIALATRTGD